MTCLQHFYICTVPEAKSISISINGMKQMNHSAVGWHLPKNSVASSARRDIAAGWRLRRAVKRISIPLDIFLRKHLLSLPNKDIGIFGRGCNFGWWKLTWIKHTLMRQQNFWKKPCMLLARSNERY